MKKKSVEQKIKETQERYYTQEVEKHFNPTTQDKLYDILEKYRLTDKYMPHQAIEDIEWVFKD